MGIWLWISRRPDDTSIRGVVTSTLGPGVQEDVAGGEPVPGDAVVAGEHDGHHAVAAGQIRRWNITTEATHQPS